MRLLEKGGDPMSEQELTDALEEVLASMTADLDELEDDVETAARAVKW